MAGVNIENSGLLFTEYEHTIVETLNQESKARNLVKQNKKWTGSHLEWPIQTARNHAISWLEDGGALPVADKQDYKRLKAYRKFVSASLQLTDGIMAAASGGKAVVKSVIDSEVKGMIENVLKQENGFFFRDGSGSVARVKTGSSGTTLLVDDARMLWDGAVYEVYDNDGTSGAPGTLRGTFTVTSTASAPTASGFATVTTSSLPSGTAADDHVLWYGALNRVITGLDKLIDDAAVTFQGLAIGTYPRYSSLVLDGGGAAQDLTPTLFRQMHAGIFQKTGRKPASGLTCMTNANQAINVEELYEAELRLAPSDKVAGLAVSSFQTAMGRVDVSTDSDALYGKMFFLDPSEIERCTQQEFGWRRREGEPMFKRDDSALRYTATAVGIYDMRIMDRRTCGKIENLNETNVTMY
jgi:hypothetical protein